MFYFGGMTLGYLTPPVPKGVAKNGEIVAADRPDEQGRPNMDRLPDGKSLLARAQWFGLYW